MKSKKLVKIIILIAAIALVLFLVWHFILSKKNLETENEQQLLSPTEFKNLLIDLTKHPVFNRLKSSDTSLTTGFGKELSGVQTQGRDNPFVGQLETKKEE